MYKVIRAVIKIGCSSELKATRKFFDDKFEMKKIFKREKGRLRIYPEIYIYKTTIKMIKYCFTYNVLISNSTQFKKKIERGGGVGVAFLLIKLRLVRN